jgi:hypothetical protein
MRDNVRTATKYDLELKKVHQGAKKGAKRYHARPSVTNREKD